MSSEKLCQLEPWLLLPNQPLSASRARLRRATPRWWASPCAQRPNLTRPARQDRPASLGTARCNSRWTAPAPRVQHSRVTSPRILAVATFSLTVVAVVGLILDGPRAAYFPAATAILAGLPIYLQIRHPQTSKQWTTRRVIDTTAFFVLLAAFVVGGFMVSGPANPIPWTMPVTVLVIIATMPFSLVGLVREAFQASKAAPRAANERDHGTGPTA